MAPLLNSTNPSDALVVGGQYNTTPPAPANGVTLPFQVDSSGNLLVTLAAAVSGQQIAASAETSTIFNGTSALTPLFSTIAVSSSGATTVVAAVAAKKIRVVAMQLVANGAVNVKWQSHVTPTDITGLAYLAQNGGYVLPFNPVGWFQTIAGEALDINLSASVAVGGSLTYITV